MTKHLTRVCLKVVRRKSIELPETSIRGPECVAALAQRLLRDEAQEVMLVFFLNTQHQVDAYAEVSRGILDANLVHPRELFKAAIMYNTAAIVMVHNHPSGECAPSHEDKTVTKQMAEAGRLLGIPVLDHLVVSHKGFTSLRDHL